LSYPWIPNSAREIEEELLKTIGVESIEELFSDIPEELRLHRPLNVGYGKPLSEAEVTRIFHEKVSRNKVFTNPPPFMGGGVCPHHVPSLVWEVLRRAEFYSAYTPYQAEISQGLLQALFEYQSLMADLLEMDVVNSSMYDMSTAVAEAFMMAARVTRRKRILVPETMNPRHLEVARTITQGQGIVLEKVRSLRDSGMMDLGDLRGKISSDVAAVYVENPGYLGFYEQQVDEISSETHSHGALFIAGIEPLSLGLVKPPGSYDADIAVGEGQPLGLGLNYGGPLLGIFAVKWDRRLVRQMPGRLIGLTEDAEGRRGYAMILQTREQHIRREKATSNITTNESLMAIAAAVYLSLLGSTGICELAEEIARRAQYASRRLGEIEGVTSPLYKPHFKEFTVIFDEDYRGIHEYLLNNGVLGGYSLREEFPGLGNAALFCVTELHGKQDIDMLASLVEEYMSHGRR